MCLRQCELIMCHLLFLLHLFVYGNRYLSKTTAMLPAPISPYAISKLAGGIICQCFRRIMGLLQLLPAFLMSLVRDKAFKVAIRCSTYFYQKAINNQTITIYGDGEQTRDFIYVKDIVHYLYLLAKANKSDVFNLGYGKSTTINNLARTIIENIKSKSTIVYEEERAGDIKHSFAQVDVINMMSYSPIGLNAGIQETINYYKANVSF